jgi:hypothetical protein
MNIRRRFAVAMLLPLGAAIGGLCTPAAATGPGLAAADQVSEASYRDFLDNWLYTHVGDDRGFGPEHDLARDNIVAFFEFYGLDVTLEPFPYGGDTYYNVVGTMTGTIQPDQEYIVGAHFDSVNNPGADDNASGTALVLEAARILTQYDSAYTIRFIAFDREEQGLIGSTHYVNDHFGDDILGMISADMVAYNTGANAADIKCGNSSIALKNALVNAVAEYGDGLNAQPTGASGSSDHAPFEDAGYDACLVIEDWGNPNYHQQTDNVDMPDYIDYALATRITRSVVGWLTDAAEVDVPFDGLAFEYPNGLPDYLDPNGGTVIRVEVVPSGAESPQPGTGLLHYDAGAGWQIVSMDEVSPNVYDAAMPGADCTLTIVYYFSAQSTTATTYDDPWFAPAETYAAIAAYAYAEPVHDDFETDQGWVPQNFGATAGDWERGVPVNGSPFDPRTDADGSGQCYVTGNQGNENVDNGAVGLMSPELDLSGGNVGITYQYYAFITDVSHDFLTVEISPNSDAGPWTGIAVHPSGGTSWLEYEITGAEIEAAGVTLTENMRVRFTANDDDPQSIVECAIDDFRVYDYDCEKPCPADITGDDVVDVQDFLALLAAWGQPGGPADINDDGTVDVLDFLDLLSAWGPCP